MAAPQTEGTVQYCKEQRFVCMLSGGTCPRPTKGEHNTGATEEPAPSVRPTFLFISASGPPVPIRRWSGRLKRSVLCFRTHSRAEAWDLKLTLTSLPF